jgi:colicin import membrane protein
MSNELIEINETTALQAFSSDNGLDEVIKQAKELVDGFEHDLSTDAGRKRTASLANKVAKLKVRMDGLGKSLTDDWAKKKKAVDANRKQMRDALDALKVEARKPLTDWEAEQKAIEEAKAAAELQKQIDADHEIALLLNEKFDAEIAAKVEAERKAEEERQAQLKAEQEEREKRIAEEAAERERLASLEREKQAKEQAEAAERARIAAEERAKVEIEKAAEAARQAEINRQAAEAKRLADEQAKREADRAYIGSVRKAAKDDLMKLGLDEETAKKVVLAISAGDISNVTINY